MEILIDFPGGVRVDAHLGSLTVQTDQSVYEGGQGSAPSPFALFLASIGTCAGFYVLSFCRSREIPTEGIRLIERREVDPETHLVSRVLIEVQLPPEFPEKYKTAIIRAADQCTVKKHLEHPPAIEVTTSVAEAVRV